METQDYWYQSNSDNLDRKKTSENQWKKTLTISGLVFFLWLSYFFGFGIFFSIAIFFIFPTYYKLRAIAFQALIVQLFCIALFYPIELLYIFKPDWEFSINQILNISFPLVSYLSIFIALVILFSERSRIQKYAQKMNSLDGYYYLRRHSISNYMYIAVVWFLSIVFGFFYSDLIGTIINSLQKNPEVDLNKFVSDDKMIFMMFRESFTSFWLVFFSLVTSNVRNGLFGFLRRFFIGFTYQNKLSRPTINFNSETYYKKSQYAQIRELILPGWGHIYLKRNWTGFPLLFIFLLVLFFLSISIAYYLDISSGVLYLLSFGLKFGINDKTFIPIISNWITLTGLIVLLVTWIIYSNWLLHQALLKDDQPIKKRGLQSGFFNNLQLSLLAHLIIITLIIIIPISIQKTSGEKKQNEASNYQPEHLEYYFIDPEIPDEVKDLNGGVISGIETPSKNEGENIPDADLSEEGKVKGYKKRIKGKKLPKTYSNYISARMRGPEQFTEYWKSAPGFYSCVAGYTITTEGEIIDVEIIEPSNSPEQDQLTLELIKSMSPVMPPPNANGDVRVTELFWNGSLDPNLMPTELQKDLVTKFDGRVMEEF